METTKTTISNKAILVISLVRKAIQSSPTGVTFFSLKNYTNKNNEVSNNTINIGASLKNAKIKDTPFLKDLDVTKLTDTKSDVETLEEARVKLIEAFEKPNANRSKGQINAYTIITEGVKVHNDTGLLYVYGLRTNKNVLVEGTYPTVNSRPLTIAKNELRKLLKSSRFTQFSIEVGNEITAKGETIEL